MQGEGAHPASAAVAVLSDSAWRARFGGAAAVIGRSLELKQCRLHRYRSGAAKLSRR